MKKVNTANIKVQFGGRNPPKDDFLLAFLNKAYKGELLVHTAFIKTKAIKPFSDYIPQTSIEFKNYFEELEKQGKPPLLYVYPNESKFIMSDDYNAYYLYIEKGYKKIMCLILGDSDSEYIIYQSEAFILPPPSEVTSI